MCLIVHIADLILKIKPFRRDYSSVNISQLQNVSLLPLFLSLSPLYTLHFSISFHRFSSIVKLYGIGSCLLMTSINLEYFCVITLTDVVSETAVISKLLVELKPSCARKLHCYPEYLLKQPMILIRQQACGS